MTHKVILADGAGFNYKVCITKAGQLTVAPFSYDDTMHVELGEPDTGYTFYNPIDNQRFVITGIVAKADKQVSSIVDAQVVIYESEDSDTTTVSRVLFETAMVEGDSLTVMPLNIITTEGIWVNAKTTDDDIHMTIMGYYIPT